MPNTYSQLYVQVVFAVQGRKHFIKEDIREELQQYIAGIIAHKNQKLYAIYCMPNHTHIFISHQPNITISDITRDIKASSSGWLKEKLHAFQSFAWQEGFGAFSYSKSQSQKVVDYIINQPNHHKKKTFRDEYIELLNAFEVKYDSKYLFEFYND